MDNSLLYSLVLMVIQYYVQCNLDYYFNSYTVIDYNRFFFLKYAAIPILAAIIAEQIPINGAKSIIS